VGKRIYAPELHGAPLDKVDRLPEHDYFGLGVLIFRLLMKGTILLPGIKTKYQLNEPVQYYCLKMGAFPYVTTGCRPTADGASFNIYSRSAQSVLELFLWPGTNCRLALAARMGARAGERRKNLVSCKTNKEHYYSRHLAQCPWCQREQNKPKVPLQTALPPRVLPPHLTAQDHCASVAIIFYNSLPSPAPAPRRQPLPVLFPAHPRRGFASIRRFMKSIPDLARRLFRSPGIY